MSYTSNNYNANREEGVFQNIENDNQSDISESEIINRESNHPVELNSNTLDTNSINEQPFVLRTSQRTNDQVNQVSSLDINHTRVLNIMTSHQIERSKIKRTINLAVWIVAIIFSAMSISISCFLISDIKKASNILDKCINKSDCEKLLDADNLLKDIYRIVISLLVIIIFSTLAAIYSLLFGIKKIFDIYRKGDRLNLR